MEGTSQPLGAGDITAALDWWREAGVDLDFADAPVHWLARPDAQEPRLPAAYAAETASPSARPAPQEDKTAEQIGGDRAGWPADLDAFAHWWLTEPSLDGGQVRNRVPPRGPTGAALMVLVAEPEPDDREALLQGPAGRLLDAMLAAMGLGPDEVYFASVLPRTTPLADWAGLAARGLGQIVRHHVELVTPRRLLLFGSSALPLLGHDSAQNAQTSLTFNHDNGAIPLMAAHELRNYAGKPMRKAKFWQRWLEFSGSETGGHQ